MDTDALVEACRKAAGEPQPSLAVKEVLEQAVRDGISGLFDTDELTLQVLSCDPDLTVLQVVVPAGPRWSLPHDHRMWAAIGVCDGREDNEFFRRAAPSIEGSGGRAVESGQVLLLGHDVIHRIHNPLDRPLRAIHVYGGDFPSARRSMWTEPGWREEPYDAVRATGTAIRPPAS
jgi:predicted metal-dependent enzyme (double-stranded beta helix superfamily)